MKINSKVCVLISAVFLSLSCGKDSDVDPVSTCDGKLELYTTQINTFANAPTKGNCQVLVNTLDEIIKDCTFIGAGQRQALQTSRNEINCNDL